MRSASLPSVFRRILLASLAGTSALAATGCGANVVGPVDGESPDVVTRDAPPPVDVIDRRDTIDREDVIERPDAVDASDAAVCPPSYATSTCSSTVTFPCNPPAGVVPGGSIDQATCMRVCPAGMFGGGTAIWCNARAGAAGETVVDCTYCAVGRRTEGLAEPDARAPGNAVGQFLANNATLEAASVTAFERMREELAAHGAPASLLEALSRAADEERDHAERVTREARRFGVEPQEPRFAPAALRPLHAVARENAVEGCVRETFGALVAAWQARRAEDAALAAMYARLADDEARHAALSWRVDEWALPQLSEFERADVERARREAIAGLYADLAGPEAPALVRVAGLPDAAAARTILDGLASGLWDAAAAAN